ncbi:MAG: lipase family protein [Acidobacteriia bacterium]|nr:lipase family protein [Terriglobia bacterium]
MAFDFDPQATVLSPGNARLLGQAAAVSYEDASTCETWARASGFDEAFEFFSSTGVTPHSDTQGFVAQNQQIVLVAFRGTQPNQPLDWLSDFEASHETWGNPAGRVHKGFYEALRAVWGIPIGGQEILPARLTSRGARAVWITGHSLGGALAELCAAQAYFVSHVPVQGVYTFGQPRVGDETFARTVHAALGTRIFRFINDRDIVPRVPFFGMGFRHYGCEIFFDHQQQERNGTPCVENLAAALRLMGLALNLDAIEEAGKLLAQATMQAGLTGSVQEALHQIVRAREETVLGYVRTVLAAGADNITDHNMRNDYLARLGTSLAVGQNA